MSGPVEPWTPWTTATKAAAALQKSLVDLRTNRAATVEAVKADLVKGTRRDALTILRFLNAELALELLDELLDLALSDAYTLAVRELLGRLPHHQVGEVVPPAVWKLLEAENDYTAYRRMAELLHHLGLADALRELVRVAYDSQDPDVREVASDFA